MLAAVEASSRDVIAELRQLLETLRAHGNDADVAASTLTLADIPALVSAARETGLPTQYTVVGEPREVPQVVAVNLYRIAQEALTNARRHAGPHVTADVRIRYTADAVELEVTNTGRLLAAPRPGLGLLGMRERTIVAGGEIEIGPRERGGFRVRATFPAAAAGARG